MGGPPRLRRRVSGIAVHRGAGHKSVVQVGGALDASTASALRSHLLPLVEHGTVVFDASAITSCNAAGVYLLLEATNHARAHGAVLRLAAPGESVGRVMEVTGAVTVIEVFPDVESALRD